MEKVKKMKAIKMMCLVMAVVMVMFLPGCGKEKADVEYIKYQLELSSELTTAKLKFTGLAEYKDSGMGWKKGNYKMLYKATARVGIDVEKVEITCDEEAKIVYVKIPKAEVQDVKVDSKNITYFDKKFAPLNWDAKEDAVAGIAQAEEEAAKEIKKMGNLEMADKQAESLIKGLLINAIPKGYTIEVKK